MNHVLNSDKPDKVALVEGDNTFTYAHTLIGALGSLPVESSLASAILRRRALPFSFRPASIM